MSHCTTVCVWAYVVPHVPESPVTKADVDMTVKNVPRTIGTRIQTIPYDMIKARSESPRNTRLDTF